ncbi:ABC transporter substrate-binding protein [Brachybacterium fresconis]|uniref:Iron complex transport system substrate-binding protein n=1 Tax=Brachybacterium fresconis TaxID=173363 RepID=A0ABS4YNA7_9MICO|nr:ABC transporter substrate-binding protein [Brachybacterium fresconis]MBP2410100.1 iron complex transport system substrate-binding protein [Brachybacterium fresconis]
MLRPSPRRPGDPTDRPTLGREGLDRPNPLREEAAHRGLERGTVSRRGALAGLAGLAGLTAAGCTAGSGAGPDAGDGTDGDATSGFPLELANCEATLRFEAPPERIVLLESAPVTTLDGIGVLDRVVSRAGAFPPGYYDEDLTARIEAIPALSEDIDAAGHLQINQEVVIAQRPDIVFGLPDGVTREAMRGADAEVVVQDVFCGSNGERASFETLYEEIGTYGQIFDRAPQAEELTTSLQERIATVSESAKTLRTTTAAALYPSLGGGPLYTYGTGSMVTAQLDALGLQNAFADSAERVFEISAEPLLAADPDVLIVLYQGEGDGSDVTEEMIAQDQLSALRAVQDQQVLPLLFNFSEPASPLVVDGLERIHEWLLEIET